MDFGLYILINRPDLVSYNSTCNMYFLTTRNTILNFKCLSFEVLKTMGLQWESFE